VSCIRIRDIDDLFQPLLVLGTVEEAGCDLLQMADQLLIDHHSSMGRLYRTISRNVVCPERQFTEKHSLTCTSASA
jgi:hypothetical protein